MGSVDFLRSIAPAVAGVWFTSLWQGVLLAAMVSIGLRLAPRTTANVRFVIWLGLFLAMLVLPLWAADARSEGVAVQSSASGGSVLPGIHPFSVNAAWAMALVVIWALASLARAAGLLRNAYRLQRLLRDAVPVADEFAAALLVGASGDGREAKLCTSATIAQPCVLGFFAPRVLLPDWLLAKATTAELRQIVLHEIEHLRRMDDWSNLGQKLMLVCFPLHPALLWVERRLCIERERACDERVVEATHAPGAYATCLTNLAEQRLQVKASALSLGAWERKPELSKRVESILAGGARLKAWQSGALIAGFVLTVAIGGERLAELPQLVSFTTPGAQQMEAIHQSEKPRDPAFRDVVYRPTEQRPAAFSRSLSGSLPVSLSAKGAPGAGRRKPSSAGGPSAGGQASTSGEDSWVVITRWESLSGEQITVTRVRRDAQIHETRMLTLPPGWYVVSL